MAIYKTDIVDVDLDSGTIYRSFAQRVVGEGDVKANRFGVRLWRNGEAASAGGATCIGYFIRYTSGDTVTISGGAFSGQEAWVELPESCYAVDGCFTLVIKLVGVGVTGTMRIVDGTVVNSVLGPMIDPGTTIPDLSELLAVIGRAEAAAATVGGFAVYAEQIDGDEYRVIISNGTSS